MICVGTDTTDMELMKIGSDEIAEVYVGNTKVWPDRPLTITDLDPNGHEYVDMGEAGIWGAHNVGAANPEDAGQYFAWGETTGYYAGQVGKGSGQRLFRGPEYRFAASYSSWTSGYRLSTVSKYCVQSVLGTVDNRLVLEPSDDAAHINWGGDWRIPSVEEWTRLCNLCTMVETQRNGVQGVLLTLAADSTKSMFIPYAGYAYGNRVTKSKSGYHACDTYLRNCLFDNSICPRNGYMQSGFQHREYGLPIRPILAKPINKSLLPHTLTLMASGEGTVGFNESCGHEIISKDVTDIDTVTVYGSPGSNLLGWYIGNEYRSKGVSNSTNVSTSGVSTVVADFSVTKYTITINGDDYGDVWFSDLDEKTVEAPLNTAQQSFVKGSMVSIFAYPKDNCVFEGWFKNSVLISSELSYEFEAVENALYEAKFRQSSVGPGPVEPPEPGNNIAFTVTSAQIITPNELTLDIHASAATPSVVLIPIRFMVQGMSEEATFSFDQGTTDSTQTFSIGFNLDEATMVTVGSGGTIPDSGGYTYTNISTYRIK